MAVNEKNLKEMIDTRVGALTNAASETGDVIASVRFLQAATAKGTGTAVAANKSLVDTIGFDGASHLGTGLDSDVASLKRAAITATPVAKSVEAYVSDRVSPTYTVYPNLANDITLTGAGAWANGAWAEIVAANGIAVEFWIAGINLGGFSGQDTFEVEIGTGGAGAEVGVAQVKFSVTLAAQDGQHFRLPKPIRVAANTRVAGRVATGGGGNKTATCGIQVATGL